MKCLKCNKEAQHTLSVDIDVPSMGACSTHLDEIQDDMMIALNGGPEALKYFEKKYDL